MGENREATAAEVARALGVSHQNFAYRARKYNFARTAAGHYLLADAVAAYHATTREVDEPGQGLEAERIRKLRLANDRAEGLVHEVAGCTRARFAAGRHVRDAAMQWAPDVAQRIAARWAGVDARQLAAMIDGEIRTLFHRIAREVEEVGGGDGAEGRAA